MKKRNKDWLLAEWLGEEACYTGWKGSSSAAWTTAGNAIITLCTENAGKVGVLVRGAKKVKSRHAALIQLFTVGEFVF